MRRLAWMIALALVPQPALAQKPDPQEIERAKKFFDVGVQAYEAGQYLAAAQAFEEAYGVTPFPAIAFSMAQAYRRQYFVDRDPGRLKRAVALYKQYVADVASGGRRDDAIQQLADLEPLLARIEEQQRREGRGPVQESRVEATSTQLMISSRAKGARATIDDSDPAEVPVVREVKPGKHIIRVEAPGYYAVETEEVAVEGRLIPVQVELQPRPAVVTLDAPSGVEVSVDGRPAPLAGGRLQLDAGKHFIAVSKRGHYPFTRELTLDRGQELDLKADLEVTSQRKLSYWFLGGAGGAFIAANLSLTFSLVAQKNASDLLDKRDNQMMNLTAAELDEYETQRTRRDRLRATSFVLYGTAAAAGLTGLLLYFMDTPRVEAPPPTTVTPTVTPDSASLSLTGTF